MVVVEDMLLAGYPLAAVVAACTEQFGVTEGSVYRWAQAVEKGWQATEDVERRERRARHRAKLAALYRRAWDEDDLLVCVQVAKLEAMVDGLHAPTKVELSGQVAVVAMTPEQRREEIRRLLEMRDRALAAQPAPALALPSPPAKIVDAESVEAPR